MPDEQYPEFKTPSEKLISDQCTDLGAGSHSQSSGSEAHGSISQSNPTSNSGAIDELGLIGKVIGDHYKILRLIGVGGMGAVYEAQDILLGRQVAIKFASGGLLRSEKSALRFQKEARALGQLDHNNIVRVSDFGIYDEKMPFMVMQFVGGKPLSEVLTQALPIDDTITIALQLCNALIHAHEKGIFHRDLKPSNILVEDGLSNNIKIIDFGIATLTSEDNRMHLTNTGEVFGSPLYMSPEQCAGLKADNRSDIYALGCIIYECLTGAPPLVGETALTTMMKHQQDVPLSLKQASLGKEFPPALENIVAKALAKAPEQRYQTIAGLRHDLEAVRDGKSLNIDGEIERTSPAQKADKSLMIGIGLVVGLILLGVLGTLVYFFLSDHDQSSPVVAVHEEPTIAFPLAHCAKAMEDAEHGAPSADFTDCADIGADELKRLSNLPNLSELMLSNTSITTHDLAELNPHLIALHIRGCNVNLAGIKHLRDLKELERLEVSRTQISDDCLLELKDFPSLIFLDVQNCKEITADSLRNFLDARRQCVVFASSLDIERPSVSESNWIAFRTHKSLHKLKEVSQRCYVESLDIGSSEVEDKDAPLIANLPVRFLNLFKCTGLTPDGIKTILGCKSLLNIAAERSNFNDLDCAAINQQMQEVELSHTPVTTDGVKYLSNCKNLRVIKLNGDKVKATILKDLDSLNLLNMLSLKDTGITDLDVQSFRKHHPRCNVEVGTTSGTLRQQWLTNPYSASPTVHKH